MMNTFVRIITRRASVLALMALGSHSLFAQEPNIESHLAAIERGQADEVRGELPSLLKNYPNNPGVLYVQALLTSDGAEAARLYQKIVDKHAGSNWADDALWKVYKFYSAIGLDRTAEIKLEQLKTQYPDSKYLTGKEEPPIAAGQNPEPQSHASTQQRTPEHRDSVSVPPRESLPPVAAKSETAAERGKYTLQVGVYSTLANADKQKQFFEYQQYPVDIVSKMRGGRELFFVFVGSFATETNAWEKGEEIKRAFDIDYFVVTR